MPGTCQLGLAAFCCSRHGRDTSSWNSCDVRILVMVESWTPSVDCATKLRTLNIAQRLGQIIPEESNTACFVCFPWEDSFPAGDCRAPCREFKRGLPESYSARRVSSSTGENEGAFFFMKPVRCIHRTRSSLGYNALCRSQRACSCAVGAHVLHALFKSATSPKFDGFGTVSYCYFPHTYRP